MSSTFLGNKDKEKSKNINQIFWFIFVGTIGFIVDAGILEFVVKYTDTGLFRGRVISFSIAVIVTWQLNRILTFKQEEVSVIGVKKALLEFLKYLFSSSLSISINFGIYSFLIVSFVLCHDIPSLAVALGSVAAMFVTFFMSKYWVFK